MPARYHPRLKIFYITFILVVTLFHSPNTFYVAAQSHLIQPSETPVLQRQSLCEGGCIGGYEGCRGDFDCKGDLACMDSICQIDGDYWWVLGVGLSIIGSCLSMLGVNMQKFFFMKEAKKKK